MKRVLITGANGFIGRHCLPLLVTAGYEVHAVTRTTPKNEKLEEGVRWHTADLFEPSQVSELMSLVRPTQLLHLAWYSVPGKFWSSLENVRWLQASLDLVREFVECGGERVVAAGSCAEYSWVDGPILSELTTRISPSTLYGACKHALHGVLEAVAAEKKLSVAWGRVFFLYGPHEHPERLTASVIRSLLQGDAAQCSHGQQVRDFLYVQDVASALVALLQSQVSGPVNIASGEGVAVRDLVAKIGDAIGRGDLIRLGERPADDEPPVLVADVTRLRDEVGWHPEYSIDSGLTLAIEWWRQNLATGGMGKAECG